MSKWYYIAVWALRPVPFFVGNKLLWYDYFRYGALMKLPIFVQNMSVRQQTIINNYIAELDKHIADLRAGRAENTLEISDFAALLHIHPGHLSNTIHEVLGKSPCDIYEEKLMGVARELLLERDTPIKNIAFQLAFDPSNFTKFFKKYEGVTPKQFREASFVIN